MDQDPDTDFVRAGAVEMHLDMSQEPLDAENLQVKCRRPAVDQDRDTDFVPACAVEMHVHKSHFIPKFTGKMPDDNEQRHKRRAKQRHKRRDKTASQANASPRAPCQSNPNTRVKEHLNCWRVFHLLKQIIQHDGGKRQQDVSVG